MKKIRNSFRSNLFRIHFIIFEFILFQIHPYGTPYSTVNEKGTEDKSHKLLLKKPFTI